MARSALIHKLVGTGLGASPPTLRTSALALVYAPLNTVPQHGVEADTPTY